MSMIVVAEEVAAYATADVYVFYCRRSRCFAVEVYNMAVVALQVVAVRRLYAAISCAAATASFVAAFSGWRC